MGELRLGRLRYTIAGLIFALLLLQSAEISWFELNGAPVSSLFAGGVEAQAIGVGFGGAFALWGLVPIERRWPLRVAVVVAAMAVFFVALNIVDPGGRLDAGRAFGLVRDGAEITYAPGMLLAVVAAAGAFFVAVWTLRDERGR